MKGLFASSIKLSEEEYAKIFQSGGERAFDFFYRQYFSALCFFANTYLHNEDDAKELVQDCFANLWIKHKLVRNPEAIKSFLYTTVRNACLNQIRNNKTETRRKEEVFYLTDIEDDNWLDRVTQAEVMREIYAAIELLPTQTRKVFKMYYIEGKTPIEIASILQTTPSSVRKQRLRALELVKLRLTPSVFVILTTQWINSVN